MTLGHAKRISAIVSALAASAAVSAVDTVAAEPGAPVAAESAAAAPRIESIVAMPIGALKAVVSNGELLYISDSGRYVLRGTLFDAWERKPIKSIEEVRESVNHVHLDRMGIQVAELGPLTYGTGRERITVFVDPKCPWCAKLMKQVKDKPELAKQYTFDFIAIPVLGPASQRLVRELGCATDRQAALNALMREDYGKPLEQNKSCDLKPIQKAMTTAQILGIHGVPYTIRADGMVSRGLPADLIGWLVAKK
jgi:thiol:disulfide interchange protein DsbC